MEARKWCGRGRRGEERKGRGKLKGDGSLSLHYLVKNTF